MTILQLSLWDHKQCRRCAIPKAPELFAADKSNRDGLHSYCKDCIAELNRERSHKNPERYRAEADRYRKNNPEKVRRYIESHREQKRASERAYRLRNPVANMAGTNNYRARKKNANGSYTTKEWRELCAYYGNRCLCCGTQKRISIDHIVPLIQGGSNTIDNLQPLCMGCNARKGSKVIDYRSLAKS